MNDFICILILLIIENILFVWYLHSSNNSKKCKHEWSKWKRVDYEGYNGWTKRACIIEEQERTCQKCGLTEVERL